MADHHSVCVTSIYIYIHNMTLENMFSNNFDLYISIDPFSFFLARAGSFGKSFCLPILSEYLIGRMVRYCQLLCVFALKMSRHFLNLEPALAQPFLRPICSECHSLLGDES